MNKPVRALSRCALIAGVLGVIATAAVSLADPPRPWIGCWRDINCLDVWNPVICDNGQVYSNGCYAYRACATGCVPY